MKIEQIERVFLEKVQGYADELDALSFEVNSYRKSTVASVYLRMIRLDFVYWKKGDILRSSSTLFCRIYFQKNELFYFHLPEIMDQMDSSDFRCCYFPYIENDDRLDACFRALTALLHTYLPELTRIALDASTVDTLKERQFGEIKRLFSIKEKNLPKNPEQLESYKLSLLSLWESNILISHFTTERAYQSFLQGRYADAVVRYKKSLDSKRLIQYEIRLFDFLQSIAPDAKYEAIPSSCFAIRDMQQYHQGGKDFRWYAASALICFCACSIVFGLLGVAGNALAANGSLYYAGMPWYAMVCRDYFCRTSRNFWRNCVSRLNHPMDGQRKSKASIGIRSNTPLT